MQGVRRFFFFSDILSRSVRTQADKIRRNDKACFREEEEKEEELAGLDSTRKS